jgi:hypothetical protein
MADENDTTQVEAPEHDDSQITLADVKRLRVEAGDVLVLSIDDKLPASVVEHIYEIMQEKFPGVPCICIAHPAFDLGVADLRADFPAEVDAAFERIARGKLADQVADAIVDAILPSVGDQDAQHSHRQAQRMTARDRAKEAFRRVRD